MKVVFQSIVPIFILAVALIACKKETITPQPDDTNTPPAVAVYDSTQSYTLTDISYGNDPQQKMDIYLPANRSKDSTKVFILIHGGGWSSGDKADFVYFFNTLKLYYPHHAIVNINYRLGTYLSPGYPKQIQDIQQAINHIQHPNYQLESEYFIFGNSAGGHLGMFYGYRYDTLHQVKAICNTVGPADFTDVSYTGNSVYDYALSSFVGPITYAQNPTLYAEVSPVKYITANSPKTISFYGDNDPLIPATQMGILHNELTAKGVYNESTQYAGEGHGNWNQTNSNDYTAKIANFINQHFNY